LGKLGEALLQAANAAGTSDLVGKLNSFGEPREWAALAGIVFDVAGGDSGAALLVERAAAALADLVTSMRMRLSMDGPVVLAGGQLLNQPRLESAVRELVGEATRLEEPPVAGAVKLAGLSLTV
jgi:N-acetylglucosamine kinase-like BadF-type ATPase